MYMPTAGYWCCQPGASIRGLGVAPPDFGQGVAGGSRRGVKYYYILSCTGSRSMFESGDFWRKIE